VFNPWLKKSSPPTRPIRLRRASGRQARVVGNGDEMVFLNGKRRFPPEIVKIYQRTLKSASNRQKSAVVGEF